MGKALVIMATLLWVGVVAETASAQLELASFDAVSSDTLVAYSAGDGPDLSVTPINAGFIAILGGNFYATPTTALRVTGDGDPLVMAVGRQAFTVGPLPVQLAMGGFANVELINSIQSPDVTASGRAYVRTAGGVPTGLERELYDEVIEENSFMEIDAVDDTSVMGILGPGVYELVIEHRALRSEVGPDFPAGTFFWEEHQGAGFPGIGVVFEAEALPEPATAALLGLASLALLRRRR